MKRRIGKIYGIPIIEGGGIETLSENELLYKDGVLIGLDNSKRVDIINRQYLRILNKGKSIGTTISREDFEFLKINSIITDGQTDVTYNFITNMRTIKSIYNPSYPNDVYIIGTLHNGNIGIIKYSLVGNIVKITNRMNTKVKIN